MVPQGGAVQDLHHQRCRWRPFHAGVRGVCTGGVTQCRRRRRGGQGSSDSRGGPGHRTTAGRTGRGNHGPTEEGATGACWCCRSSGGGWVGGGWVGPPGHGLVRGAAHKTVGQDIMNNGQRNTVGRGTAEFPALQLDNGPVHGTVMPAVHWHPLAAGQIPRQAIMRTTPPTHTHTRTQKQFATHVPTQPLGSGLGLRLG